VGGVGGGGDGHFIVTMLESRYNSATTAAAVRWQCVPRDGFRGFKGLEAVVVAESERWQCLFGDGEV
jgi:hypothetical protein